MNANVHCQLNRRKRRILRRIENRPGVEGQLPMMAAANIHYEIAEVISIAPGYRQHPLPAPGQSLVRDIDEGLHLLKRHPPQHESDHVLNLAHNLLRFAANGSNTSKSGVTMKSTSTPSGLPSLTPRPRNFCRRFTEADVVQLMEIFNEIRLRVWNEQPKDFFDEAFFDVDAQRLPPGRLVRRACRHRLRGNLGLSPVDRLAGQHRRAVVPGQPQRATGPCTSRPTFTWTRPPVAGQACRITFRATATLARPSTWTTGTKTASASSSDRCPGQSQGPADRLPDLQYNELEVGPVTQSRRYPANPGSRTRSGSPHGSSSTR